MSAQRWDPLPILELADVQGLLLSGYGSMHEARYLLLRVRDAGLARRWIGALAGRVTSSMAPEERRCTNVALTHAGFAALGLGEAELATFSVPFREGVTAPHRQRLLGDTHASAPEHWAWGGLPEDGSGEGRPAAEDIHVLLLLFARDLDAMQTVEAEEVGGLPAGGLEVVYRLAPESLPGLLNVGKFGVEHFGFADGMSQPVMRGSGRERALGGEEWRRSVIEPGELVLGYPNSYGELTPWPKLDAPGGDGDDFGRNGSYLVVRQLAQDVAAFWRYLDEATGGRDDREQMEWLAAKLVGRWPSGAPLVWAHHRDDPPLGTENGFGYADVDPHGERCPIGSHIRRANPRDSLGSDPAKALELANLHRILRRGRVYGPALPEDPSTDEHERGLFFVCLNANIERQFEFMQHTWLNNTKFAGLYDETDPLMSNPGGGSFTVQAAPVRRRLHDLQSFVTTRGAAYFFLPGIRALRLLATGPR